MTGVSPLVRVPDDGGVEPRQGVRLVDLHPMRLVEVVGEIDADEGDIVDEARRILVDVVGVGTQVHVRLIRTPFLQPRCGKGRKVSAPSTDGERGGKGGVELLTLALHETLVLLRQLFTLAGVIVLGALGFDSPDRVTQPFPAHEVDPFAALLHRHLVDAMD